MAVKGALKSTRIVTTDDLRENGGRWKLQEGPAIKVRGYTEDNIGGRKIQHGDALPVYVLGENDIRSNGGDWILQAGEAIPVTSAIGAVRGVMQGAAIPVYPVDDDGVYDSTFAGVDTFAYADKVVAVDPSNLIAYWPSWETSGVTADNYEGTAARDATWNRDITVMGTADGIGDGNTAPTYDGVNDVLDIETANLKAILTCQELAIMLWVKPLGVSWAASIDYALAWQDVGGNNRIYFQEAAGQMFWGTRAAGAFDSPREVSAGYGLGWQCLVMTRSKSDPAAGWVRGYRNGANLGDDRGGLGVYANNYQAGWMAAGGRFVTGSLCNAQVAHVAIWSGVGAPAAIQAAIVDLYTVP